MLRCVCKAARTNREEVARLLDENASLHARLAAKTLEAAGPASMLLPSTGKGPVKMFEAPTTSNT